MTMDEVQLMVTLHDEGSMCLPTLRSATVAMQRFRASGGQGQLVVVLDRATVETRQAVSSLGASLDRVIESKHGDLGLARNEAIESSQGCDIAFLDGDDLVSDNWLVESARALRSHPRVAVVHPEWLYFFDERDALIRLGTDAPSPSSFWMQQISSEATDFMWSSIWFNNVYASTSYARRSTFLRFPYKAVDLSRGLGVEDWAWNWTTLGSGVSHLVAVGTVLAVRVKAEGSLGQRNTQAGLLPDVHEPLAGPFSRLASRSTLLAERSTRPLRVDGMFQGGEPQWR